MYGENKEELCLERAEILLNIILYHITKYRDKNKEYTDNIWALGDSIWQMEKLSLTFLRRQKSYLKKKKACVMKHCFSFIKIPKLFSARDIYQEQNLTNRSGYFVLIIYWGWQILSARNCFVGSFERDKCPFITSVSYPYQWARDMRIQDFKNNHNEIKQGCL